MGKTVFRTVIYDNEIALIEDGETFTVVYNQHSTIGLTVDKAATALGIAIMKALSAGDGKTLRLHQGGLA